VDPTVTSEGLLTYLLFLPRRYESWTTVYEWFRLSNPAYVLSRWSLYMWRW